MKIAFDAKRAYQNNTGLGHYSRTLISSLATDFPQHQYFLCAPRVTEKFDISSLKNVRNITPEGFTASKLKSLWRSNLVKKDLNREGVDLYHGLSHEIPVGIQRTGIKTVVTIHDIIFERYPEQYNWVDVQIYRRKFKYACNYADHIIAISEQTKCDIMQFYKVSEEKITVCYQSCNAAFAVPVNANEKKRIKQFYNLPDNYFLYVGSIIERKNLLNICKALVLIKDRCTIPLVVIGEGGAYKKQVEGFINANGLEGQVIFLSDQATSSSVTYRNAADFPAIYQQALCMIYPSVFEGFGIPVLEALWSRTPVITSNVSCLPETGGNAVYYVNPAAPDEIAEGLLKVSSDEVLRGQMVEKGWAHAQKFTPQICAANVMDVYLRLL